MAKRRASLPPDLVPRSLAARMAQWRAEAKNWKPWPYQEQALRLMLENGQFGLFLDPGLGKSSTTLAALSILFKKKLAKRALVVAPLRVVYGVWPEEVCQWREFRDMRVALAHGGDKDQVLRMLEPEHNVVLTNYESLPWLCGNPAHLKALDADTIVFDECFAAGTLVRTAEGLKPIESIHHGDVIINEGGFCRVINMAARISKEPLVEVKLSDKTIRSTADHPFFTELGWLPAKYLTGRRLLDLAAVRDLRQRNETSSEAFSRRQRAYLLAILHAEVGASEKPEWASNCCATTRFEILGTTETFDHRPNIEDANAVREAFDREEGGSSIRAFEVRNVRAALQSEGAEITLRSRKNLLTSLRHSLHLETGRLDGRDASHAVLNSYAGQEARTSLEQGGVVAFRISGEGLEKGEAVRAQFQGSRRQRARSLGDGAASTGMPAEEIYLQLRHKVGEEAARLSYLLQSGFWRTCEEDGGGSGRRQSLRTTSSGRKERSQTIGTRVESVTYIEPGGASIVYDLEVEGCPHYEVEGVAVVHNCSRMKDPTTVRFRALRPHLAKFKRRYGLTGSPVPNSYMDLFGECYILDRGATLGQYITHYRNRYFYPTGYQMREWALLPDSAEQINKAIAPMVLRLDAQDHLKLPKVLPDDVRRVDLPPAARKEYDSIEDSLMSTLFTSPLVNSASARSKCCQLANGAVYVDPPPGDEEDWRRERRFKVVHEAKVEALVELVDELQGQQLLVAIDFHHDVAAVRKALGKDVPCINGATTKGQLAAYLDAWNAGALPLLMVHPASGGHGLNMQKSHARHVCFFGLPDNYDYYDQLWRRVWRQGNQAPFMLKHFIVARDTVDVAKMKNLERKGTTQRTFLDAMREYARERERGGKRWKGLKPGSL